MKGTGQEWFAGQGSAVSGVREELRYDANEVVVGLLAGGRVMCMKGVRLFRITIGKLPHVTVLPALGRFRHGPPLFVGLPRFAGAQVRSAVLTAADSISRNPLGMGVGTGFYKSVE
jgi:hypothetical protein